MWWRMNLSYTLKRWHRREIRRMFFFCGGGLQYSDTQSIRPSALLLFIALITLVSLSIVNRVSKVFDSNSSFLVILGCLSSLGSLLSFLMKLQTTYWYVPCPLYLRSPSILPLYISSS